MHFFCLIIGIISFPNSTAAPLILSLHNQNPDSAILIVTHCRIITCIKRAILIENGKILEENGSFCCYNCYGNANKNKFYGSEIDLFKSIN